MKVGVSRARSSRWRLPTPGRACRPVLGWRGWASSRPSGSEPLTLVSNTDVILLVKTDHNPCAGLCIHDFFSCAGLMKSQGLGEARAQRCCQARFDQCFRVWRAEPWSPASCYRVSGGLLCSQQSNIVRCCCGVLLLMPNYITKCLSEKK